MDENKPNIFEKSTEVIGGFQIFLSPLLIGILIAALVYFPNPNNFTLIIAIVIIILGIIIGLLLALKIYKSKEGTINFISRTSSTPEIEETKEKIKKNDYR
jgi:cytochrome c biogenesis protein CcdA